MNVGCLERIWVPFKYETLIIFCFGYGRINHGVKECESLF